jgi:hypothetical protein
LFPTSTIFFIFLYIWSIFGPKDIVSEAHIFFFGP